MRIENKRKTAPTISSPPGFAGKRIATNIAKLLEL
jgi:hypothetical protein